MLRSHLLVMGDRLEEWDFLFFFFLSGLQIGSAGSSCWVEGLGTVAGAAVMGEGTDSVMSTPLEKRPGQNE